MNRLLTTAVALVALGVLPVGANTIARQDPAPAKATAPLRYMRAKESGAKLFNVADKNGVVLGSAKGILAVYGERAGYLDVEAPGGVAVWVFGEYLKPTDKPGTAEITGSGVRMRPLAQSDVASYPLEMELKKGDRVKVIGRANASKPLKEDWVRIVSPPGARVWVLTAETQPIDAGLDAQAAWKEAAQSSLSSFPAYDLAGVTATEPVGDRGVKEAAATPKASEAQDSSFEAAEKLYESTRTNTKASVADWTPVREAYQRYLDKNPKGALAPQARLQLQRIEVQTEIARLRADTQILDQKRQQELQDAKERLKELEKEQGPLWGRFQARGFLERESLPGDQPRWLVRWADKPAAEIVCTSGRYDLALFERCEVGILGKLVRNAVEASATGSARPARIDVTRIEVLTVHHNP